MTNFVTSHILETDHWLGNDIQPTDRNKLIKLQAITRRNYTKWRIDVYERLRQLTCIIDVRLFIVDCACVIRATRIQIVYGIIFSEWKAVIIKR